MVQNTTIFEKSLKQKGIKEEHITLLADTLDNNFHVIISQESEGAEGAKGGGEDEQQSPAQIALELAEEKCSEIFLDQFGMPYAAVEIDEHIETLPLKSSRFRNWLCGTFYGAHDDVLGGETVTNVINVLKAKAEFGLSERKELYLRVASRPEEPYTIYYDLANKHWDVVKITADGWSVRSSNNAPIIFKRYNSQQPQVEPSAEYSPDVFDKFLDLINVDDKDERLLIKGYIISLFYPRIPKPISIVIAEKGSAKTTEHELEKKIVDPGSTETLTFPRDVNELVQKLSHNYVAYFDNVSVIKDWLSDQLCRSATGSGFSKRELYTDDDDVIYNFIRCVGINGISIVGLKPDLLDRSILRKRKPIAKQKRRKKEDVSADFEKIRPQLLGYIFDVLVKVLQVKAQGSITLNGLPRMADFAEIGEIASRAMGYDDDEFLRAYDKNIEVQIEEAIAASLVSSAIITFMEDRPVWTGTASELLEELEAIADKAKINLNAKAWPKLPTR